MALHYGAITLWICYGILMLSVYTGFIITTSMPHGGSRVHSYRLRRQTNPHYHAERAVKRVPHHQGQETLQFHKNRKDVWVCCSCHDSASLLFVGESLGEQPKRSSPSPLCQGVLALFITLFQIDLSNSMTVQPFHFC